MGFERERERENEEKDEKEEEDPCILNKPTMCVVFISQNERDTQRKIRNLKVYACMRVVM